MKKIALVTFALLGMSGFAAAQAIGGPATDVLGAHLNYGRGCAACHAPHSGSAGNGFTPSGSDQANTGSVALWGQDVSGLLGQTLKFGQMDNGNSYSTTFPASITAAIGTSTATDPTVMGVLTCLSCHDGNLAKNAMMHNKVYETVNTPAYNSTNIPTLLGNDGSQAGNYLNDHPVGDNAVMSCTGSYNWDCSISGGTVSMTGPNSSAFVANYGFFVSPGSYTTTTTGSTPVTTTVPIVVCTTCHNQHVMNVVNITSKSKSGLPTGYYTTMFFLRGPYNPNTTTAGSNQNAQFCRQCHGGEANESNGNWSIKTVF